MPPKMRLTNRPKSNSIGLRVLSAAILSALAFNYASAAGLGKLTVLSSLGQPLNAEIEVNSVNKDEIGNLTARLASAEAYRQANVELNPALYTLRFAVEERNGRQVIRVTSSQPVNEPFIDMLVELGGTSGKLLREYTFLLDPADLKTGQDTPAVTAVPSARRPQDSSPAARPASPPVVQQSPTSAAPVAPATRPPRTPSTPSTPIVSPAEQARANVSAADNSGDYRVKPGDTLSKIGGQFKREGISLDQMLVALYRANPDAFVGNNMNRLRSGQVLSVPDAAAISAIGQGEAHGVVLAQAADFNAYRNKLASQVENAPARPTQETKQNSSGKITTKVEEKPTPATTAKDKLTLSTPSKEASAKDSKAEDKIAKEKALADAKAREKELERNVKDLSNVLAKPGDKTKPAAATPAPATPAATAPAASKPAAVAATPTPTPAPTPAPAPKAAEVKPAPATPTPAPTPAPAASADAAASKPAATPTPAAPATTSTAATPAASSTSSDATPAPAKPKPKVRAPIAPPKAPEPGFLDSILDNTALLGGVAALLVGAGAIFAYSSYRKRKEKSFGDSIITDSSLKANSLFGSTGGQSVDTNNSVFNSNFAPSASQLDSNEVDPVAEADVYIAYGRDAQAEEILKEALRTQPERNAVRVKLLEIYANRKDVRAFETLASELYELTKGEGEDWLAAANLGIALDPKNPMYAAGKAPDAKTAALTAPTRPVDQHADLESLLAATEMSPSNSLEAVSESPYFGDSAMHADANPTTIAPLGKSTGNTVAPALPELTSPTSLDFDLDGLGEDPDATAQMHAPVAPAPAPAPTPAPAPAEVKADNGMDFGSVDFGFLDKPAEPAHVEAKHDQPMHLDMPALDMPSLEAITVQPAAAPHEAPMLDLPGLHAAPAPAPAAEAKHESAGNTLDFDLSGITLDLSPASHAAPEHKSEPKVETKPAPVLETAHAAAPALHETAPAMMPDFNLDGDMHLDTEVDADQSVHAEMATKLDLAVAYQEIGDKEGARELLDEVMKGGSPEQSEKAKSLLAKLG